MTSLHLGDCLDVMPTLPDGSVDAVVTDPPYGLSFMGRAWDHGVPGVAFWEAALRVAKPGAHLLAFGGTRTHHRLMVAIEDAGWEMRDTVMWVYGIGFPKSRDVSKAIDKAAGADRAVVGVRADFAARAPKNNFDQFSAINPSDKGINSRAFAEKMGQITAPATDAARQWDGWGTALKPAWEPIIVARKPLIGTVAANVLAHGTGGINVDACRIEANGERPHIERRNDKALDGDVYGSGINGSRSLGTTSQGRWPANLILGCACEGDTHDEGCAVAMLDAQSGESKSTDRPRNNSRTIGGNGKYNGGIAMVTNGYNDTGGASRFYYVAKASKRDRDEGLGGMEERVRTSYSGAESRVGKVRSDGATQHAANSVSRNHHPTVKPTALMRYLVRLVTPPGGVILDPFCGSGSTGKAAVLEGFSFIGIDTSAEYLEIAERRIAEAQTQLPLLTEAVHA